ncbi:MAG TPA: sulfur carrier protein ThiS [Candidatus Krumholzibacteria bacterium]|nr:sulfur carrier protein ThiS [Candidatus Krumholzibacteria bacterium]
MEIRINGTMSTVAADSTVADVVHSLGVDEDTSGVAVAVNDSVLPKRDWAARRLAAGDAVEVIRAVQGG